MKANRVLKPANCPTVEEVREAYKLYHRYLEYLKGDEFWKEEPENMAIGYVWKAGFLAGLETRYGMSRLRGWFETRKTEKEYSEAEYIDPEDMVVTLHDYEY